MKTVIRGAYYYDKEADVILIPHFTGEFWMVDCDEFTTMEDLEGRYDENYINEIKDNPIYLDGKKYFSAEYSPFTIGDWELLSDISELFHMEEYFDF